MVSVDAKKLKKYVFPDRYGVHRCATFGDYRDRIKDVATLIGFRVIEEDAYADILLVDGNPLEDIRILEDYAGNIDLVMKDGKIYKNTLN